MSTNLTTPIFVQREWDGWRTAEVRVGDLQSIHWFQPSGAPRALVHGYISCASIVAGTIPHNCERSAGPHRLLVCVLKRHSPPSVYAEMARVADEHRIPATIEAPAGLDREPADVMPDTAQSSPADGTGKGFMSSGRRLLFRARSASSG
jgi:hypothetical protein